MVSADVDEGGYTVMDTGGLGLTGDESGAALIAASERQVGFAIDAAAPADTRTATTRGTTGRTSAGRTASPATATERSGSLIGLSSRNHAVVITAAGISQLAWLPIEELNSRVMPAGPPNAAELRVVGPTEPVSFPFSLPSPL